MKLGAEWNGRLEHWILALQRDFYIELGEINFEGFTTFEHLKPDDAAMQKFIPFPADTVWGEEWQYLWLKGDITIPDAAEGKMIVLNLDPGGESTLFVNGAAFGTYRAPENVAPHQFYQDNIISENGKPGESFSILCEVFAGHYYAQTPGRGCSTGPVIPGYYKDPFKDTTRTVLGRNTYGIWNEDAYALWIDVITLREVMECLSDGSLRAAKIARALQKFMLEVDFEQPPEDRIKDYRKARESLRDVLDAKNGSTSPTFYSVGNAHLDVVWLWPYGETIRKTARTFAAQLRMLEKYPEYKFIQSQPQTYVMCKEHYPELYERIKDAVKAGNWIIEGGMWVEPDTNMSSGESLIRQLIYGKRFMKEEFDVDSEILWLPDTFGYSAALPQILNGCGIKYLVTQKIFWSYNQGEQFPYHYFTWQGSDGSKVISFLPTNYTYFTNPKIYIELWENRVNKDDMDKFLFPFGFGDGGGGPCRDHLEFAIRQKDLEGSPKVVMTHPLDLFRDLDADGGPEHTYVGELYFNAHRGVYTTQAAIKHGNRNAEMALREAEIWGVVAAMSGFIYPVEEMEKVWKKTLLNQFHDILPGSSIERANVEAVEVYNEILCSADEMIGEAVAYIINCGEEENGLRINRVGDSETTDGATIFSETADDISILQEDADDTDIFKEAADDTIIFNSLSWERTAVVDLSDDLDDDLGDDLSDNLSDDLSDCNKHKHALVKLPPCGYASASDVQIQIAAEDAARAVLTDSGAILENGIIRAELNQNGEVVSFTLKGSACEYAAGNMNRFALFRDTPRIFDAWDIDSMYELEPVEFDPVAELSLLYSTDIKAAVQIKKNIGNSTLCQIVSICALSRRLEFDTTVEWNELHRLLKVCFPVTVKADEAINEIQYGYIKRPTHRSRDYDKDRFEVCNHRYTALCDENNGVAVLNDCKYGVSVLGSEISLTLLRAAACPHMRSDNGTQQFTYAFTAWEGSFYASPVVREGYELNILPITVQGSKQAKSYFWLEDAGNIILDTVKPAEDGSGDIIVRLYESKRAASNSVLNTSITLKKATLTDMLENDIEVLLVERCDAGQRTEQGADQCTEDAGQITKQHYRIKLQFKPFEVKTIRLIM